MSKVLILYDSRSGNTRQMAEAVGKGVEISGVEVEVKHADSATLEDLVVADGIILGSPTHFGTMSDRVKDFIDRTNEIRGKLEGKVGATFTSCGDIFWGSETTLLSMLCAMLIHGMIVVGSREANGPYGVAVRGKMDESGLTACRKLGERVGKLVKRLTS